MRILEYIIYGYFFVKVFLWVITLLTYYMATARQRYHAEFKFKFTDNILWVAPIVYFAGGLK